MNYSIRKLTKNDYEIFADMFIDYFVNDIGIKYDVEKLKKNLVKNTIIKQYERNIIFIDIIKKDKICGFIIYQIDSELSDWNLKTGYGYIREFYIAKDYRGKGLGTLLVENAENSLKSLGVDNVYLTSAESEAVKNFYVKNKYTTNNIICAENGNVIYEKVL